MLFKHVKRGKAPDAPWEKADGNAFHIAASEGVFTLQVVADIADKLPDEPDDTGQLPEFGTWGDTKRQIRMSLLFPQDKKTLAAVLIYCWQSCLVPKVPAIKDGLAELSRVAAEHGWVTLTDVIKRTRKENKGGRRTGARDKKNLPLIKYAKDLKAANPRIKHEALLTAVSEKTVRRDKKDRWHLIPQQ